MVTYEKRNLDNLEKLADHTKIAAMKWYEEIKKLGIDILIYETIRSLDTQRANVRKGVSQTMRSYHLVGQALDWVLIDKDGDAMWNGYYSADGKKVVSLAKKYGFEWGGDWKSFKDCPHIQFNYKGYGTDTFGKHEEVKPVEKPKVETKKPEHKKETPKPASKPKEKQYIKEFQLWLNDKYKFNLSEDNLYGDKTKSAALKALQTELNKQFNAKLSVDGLWGNKTESKIPVVSEGDKGNIVGILQGMLYCLKYDPNGFDGVFGKGCEKAVKSFQKDNKLTQDGKVGQQTFEKLFK